ncbi:MAG: hypothetical protein ACREQZ_12170 [Woeseiaceae bacterium]
MIGGRRKRRHFEAARRLRLLQCGGGVGYDSVDVEAARERGVMVEVMVATRLVRY